MVGGYGLIGSYVTARLLAGGYAVRGLGRDVAAARRRVPAAQWLQLDLRLATAGDWARALENVQAVVNCAGALQDGPRDDLAAVHVAAVEGLVQACSAAGVMRLVHISAAGVAAGRPTAFNATKLAGEAVVEASRLDWVILRPGLVLAPAAYGGTSLLRGLAAFPGFAPIIYPDSVVQVVSAFDVGEACVTAMRPGAPARMRVDLVHPDSVRLADLVGALRGWLGVAPGPIARFPPFAARAAALAADAIALLGWRSPMRTAALEQLRLGVMGEGGDAARLGLELRSMAQMLAAWPSGVQERWFARLYFAKPLILVTLAAFWLASGIIGLTVSRGAAVALLSPPMSEPLAQAAVIGGSLIDVALGLGLCVRRWAGRALVGMLLVSAGYVIGAVLVRPDLWADPLGPMLKTLPAALLALAALAMLDER
ncbi:SDR family oxidoreductase [Phenylobacterium sp.]|uniref:SDR family oxidoreductase n=1 Tax=Phenylobacterium sp. TaxID=1871053 RepID=UPI002735A1DF|nr:SDR family oxidoreductase [Phenylobacterium sp.]MDP3660978.1 SDR family oxidoreductase [Phenylobacterium sp.]